MTCSVGFVGLGNIGKPMALQLAADEAIELFVYDVVADPIAAVVEAGGKAVQSVGELAMVADVISIMVRDDTQVTAVLDEILEVVDRRTGRSQLAVMVHSTIAPDTPARLEAAAAGHDVWIVDAPVSGGPMGAAAGTLAIMVGGPEEAFSAVEPVLKAMGSKVVHTGPVGSATRFKLARNLMHFIGFTAATEAQRLAEAAGLDLVALGEVVRHTDAVTGGPGAVMHRRTAQPIPVGDFWFGVFSHVRELAEKDLGYATELADQLGVDVPLARLALSRLGPGLGLPEKETT